MIFQSIINAVVTFLNLIINLFPSADSATVTLISSSVSTFRSALAAINWFFPVDTALTFFAAGLVIEFSLFTWKLIRFIASHLSLGFIK